METALVASSEGQTAPVPLDEQEERDLIMCEEIIGRGIQSFVEVGRALQTVKEARLYRAEYKTFEDYCRERWQIGRAHANRYIDASAVARILSPIGDIPTKESQVRPLTRVRKADGGLDDNMIVKLWNRAVNQASADVTGNRVVTAKIVERLVAPLIKRRRREEVIERARRHNSCGPRIAKGAAAPIRMAGGMIPMVTLQLPLNNPQATVGALASNFNRAYIEAVAAGLQRYLENGHTDPIVTPPSPEVTGEVASSGSSTAGNTGNPE
jgi:hypothetical protein